MNEQLQTLPIGVQDFAKLRQDGLLYVDKTARLLELIRNGARYFLSRPRRFGKSLTVSTLDAMFSGRAELFSGLAAEEWVKEQAKRPAPVLRLSMAGMGKTSDPALFETCLYNELAIFGRKRGLDMPRGDSEGASGALKDVLAGLSEQSGPVAVLIDEYDKPILDNIGKPELAEAMRELLRSIYTMLKDYDEYLRFVFLTGISKFSKAGVFSAMNNLQDISMMRQYGDLVGYTQEELEANFSGWLDAVSADMGLPRQELLERVKAYYDGFSFDGKTRLYNPFSVLNFFSAADFSNYWYNSGSPSFIVEYMRHHAIQDPEEYRHKEVDRHFADAQEIERAKPESFLYQGGYLTIERREGDSLFLDYPNREVLDSLSRMYLEHIYHVEDFFPLGRRTRAALEAGDIGEAVRLYNTALAGIPYRDFPKPARESFYRALFLMLLRAAGVPAGGECPTNLGRSDVAALFPNRAVVLEFKIARNAGAVERLKCEGLAQIADKNYARAFADVGRAVSAAVVVVDAEKRHAAWAAL